MVVQLLIGASLAVFQRLNAVFTDFAIVLPHMEMSSAVIYSVDVKPIFSPFVYQYFATLIRPHVSALSETISLSQMTAQ